MNQEDRNDMSLPEGFAADKDGNFMGIPPWAMRQANMLMGSCTGNRSWDVAQVGRALADVFDHRMNEILVNVQRSVEDSLTKLQSERQVTREQLNMPLDVVVQLENQRRASNALSPGQPVDQSTRLSANPDSDKNLPCPICEGIEGCDHTVTERAAAAQEADIDPLGEWIAARKEVEAQELRQYRVELGLSDEESDPSKEKTSEGPWRLMPRLHNGKAGLTDAMMRAFYDAIQHCSHRGDFERLNVGYNAMVKAAPKTPRWMFTKDVPAPNPEWIHRWTYEALVQAADICQAYANGFVSDVNPERSSERADGASACAKALLEKARELKAKPDTDKRLRKATLAFLGKRESVFRPTTVDWYAERHFKFSEWEAHMKLAIATYLGTAL